MKLERYERKVTPLERFFLRSPFSIVTVVARIKGNVSENMLKNAVIKAQQRHHNLRVRIKEDEKHNPWFTSDNIKNIPIVIIKRLSEDHWIDVHKEFSKAPFEFNDRPAIRFILVNSLEISDLIILCHHVICDGLSLAYLARDILSYLGNPEIYVETLPDPTPIDLNNLPKNVSMNMIVKFFINRMNKKWLKDQIYFDQEDYENINEAYWMKANHKIFSIEFSETQTTTLVKRCKEEGTTVNSALTMAFVGAQQHVLGTNKETTRIGVAGNLRNRLQIPAREEMGFYAGVVTLDYSYNQNKQFWENAQEFNRKVQPLYTNKNLFKDGLTWLYLNPSILEAVNFKKVGTLVPPQMSRYEKIYNFTKRDDVVLSILKREKMESLNKIYMGTAVTNLTRMDFPRMYGDLELDRLIMNPGGAFPLSNINLVLGAVTCSGKLSLIVEYDGDTVNTDSMAQVKEKAMEFLLS